MEFNAIAPSKCPECIGGPGTAVAFARSEFGWVVRLVCVDCRIVWDDISAIGGGLTFEDRRIERLPVEDTLPFAIAQGYMDYVDWAGPET